MKKLPSLPFLAALCAGTLCLAACGGPGSPGTSTPTSTLGTDSAASKVGGMPDSTLTSAPADATGAANASPNATPPPAGADH